MKVLIFGHDSYTHVLAWKLVSSEHVDELVVVPGNSGTRFLTSSVVLDSSDLGAVISFVLSAQVGLVVADLPGIAAGIVDELGSLAIPVFGSSQALASLHMSRCTAREWLQQHGLSLPRSRVCLTQAQAETYAATLSLPLAISSDDTAEPGIVCTERTAVPAAIAACLQHSPGCGVLVEELQAGPRVIASLLTNGTALQPVPAIRIAQASEAPYAETVGVHRAPSTVWQRLERYLDQDVRHPLLAALQADGRGGHGWIGTTCVLGRRGPLIQSLHLIPSGIEAAAILSCFDGDFLPLMLGCARANLASIQPASWRSEAMVAVALTSSSREQPDSFVGLDHLESGVRVFHHATASPLPKVASRLWRAKPARHHPRFGMDAARTVSPLASSAAPSTSAIVVATAPDLATARERVYTTLRRIGFRLGIIYREDVGVREL